MSRERDIERVLERWLVDGIDEMPDRVYLTILDRVERQPQRRAWRVSWRDSHVNGYLKPLIAIAAVVVVAVGGLALFGRSGSQVGGIAVPTASPTASPSPTPSRSPSATPTPLYSGTLAAGTYRLQPFDAAPGLSIDVDVPAGWEGFPKWALLGPNGTGVPGGVGIGFLMPAGLFSDPCRWDLAGDGRWPQQGDVATGTTVDDLVAALAANANHVTSAATDTTVGGYPGKRLDLELPSDVDFTACDTVTSHPTGAYFVWGTAEADGSDLYAQGPGNRWHLSIVDVEGTRIVVTYVDYVGTSDGDRAAAQAIVDSIVITP